MVATVSLEAWAPDVCAAGIYPGFIDRLITDSVAVLPAPLLPRPSYLVPMTDPLFDTRIIRITGDTNEPITLPSRTGFWGDSARHHYSKDQPWNSAGTLIAIHNAGSPRHVYLDGENYRVRYGRCSNYNVDDDRWHPSRFHPHERINVNDAELMWFDVVECVKTRSWKLPFVVTYMGGGEGNPSSDGRFVALHDSTRVFVVDMDPAPPFEPYPSQRIGPAFDVSRCEMPEGCRMTWASVSPSGRYVVVNYEGDHPRVFDVNPKTLALTPHPIPDTAPGCSAGDPAAGFIYEVAHADLAINPFDNDEEVLVGQEHCGNRGAIVQGQLIGGVVMVRLRDGAITALTDPTLEAYPHHVSARNVDRPGWVYVDYSVDPGDRFSDEIVAVKMDGSKSVQRFTHKRSAYVGCYRCESHAVPSRDGRRVLWASNWSRDCTSCGPTSEIKAYVVDARAPIRDDGNEVKNPSFESDTRGWSAYEGAAIARVAGGIEGVVALRVAGPPTRAPFGLNDSPNWVAATTAAGSRYSVSAWVRSTQHRGECRLSVREYSGQQQLNVVHSAPRVLSPQWEALTLEVTALGAGSTLDLRVLTTPSQEGEVFEVDWIAIRPLSVTAVDPGPSTVPAGAFRIAPNPAAAAATLTFATTMPGLLKVDLLDIAGRRVRQLENASLWPAGDHRLRVSWPATDEEILPTGLYFVRVESVDGVATRRLAIMR